MIYSVPLGCSIVLVNVYENVPEYELKVRFEKIKKEIFKIWEKRIHPHKDDKILTDWNGLMITALAKGAQVFRNY